MKKFRVVKDSFSGFEVQVKYPWFPFVWFQVNDFFWVNTFETEEQAIEFIKQKKSRHYTSRVRVETTSEYEFERESKLLFFKMKNFLPEVVWIEPKRELSRSPKRRVWSIFNSLGGFDSKVPGYTSAE